jgi:enterochelin esterase family protein
MQAKTARAFLLLSGLCMPAATPAQPVFPSQPTAARPAPKTCVPQGAFAVAAYKSVERHADGRVTFRVCAPDATSAMVTSNDIPEIPLSFMPGAGGLPMTKDSTGLWSVTTKQPLEADTYRFNFKINGARVPDPQGTRFSEERVGTNSTVEVLGPEGAFQAFDGKVAHGTVSTIEYWSKSLGVKRRAHVYTPPGYMRGGRPYPVLYLVHGAGDSDDSWTSVGHAQYILDNLIAAGKAKPMIIVMPAGHTPERPGVDILRNTDFGRDLIEDLIPYVEANYRTIRSPDGRAMAGLSMGGSHTINFGLPRSDLFHGIGIFSMGLGLDNGAPQVADYEARNGAALKRGAGAFKLVYFAMGKDDFLYGTVAPTRAMLDKYGIRYVYNESPGGHTWINWRRYLADFAPRLFR